MLEALPYKEIWAIDFEFQMGPGEIPIPVCLVALELKLNRLIRLWQDEMQTLSQSPYSVGEESLIVAYYASAEIGCHLSLSWPKPTNILDLFTEFRVKTNGIHLPTGSGLIGALIHHGLDSISADEKTEMRDLILSCGPWTSDQRMDILEYCKSDVDALARLLPLMLPKIDLPRALLRGQYMSAAAQMEFNGIPIDLPTLTRLRQNWDKIQDRLIESIDSDYGVFDGRSFRSKKFSEWLGHSGIPWPYQNGKLDLSEDAFRQMARSHPAVAPLHELRATLSQMRLADLAVGGDARNRVMLSAFRARTSRNQPSNSKFIFGQATWIRSLIQPPPGHAVVYIDWSQQEFAIAAALSNDKKMIQAYESGDPYLAFAIQAGAAPPDATKLIHGAIRDQFKGCALAVQYGMGEESLASRIGQPVVQARQLLRLHRETYCDFWDWSDSVSAHAMLRGFIRTVYGWPIHVGEFANDRSLRNFPMQANGAEMLRIACCLGIDRGIEICAPVHDAVLILAPLDDLEQHILTMQQAMAEASRAVLNGFELRSDCSIVRHPDRYSDPRGEVMWSKVMELLDAINAENELDEVRHAA